MKKSEITRVLKRVEKGSTLTAELAAIGISYSHWRKLCRQHGIRPSLKRGPRAKMYTPERVEIVKRRARKGEYICDVAEELGMNYKNLLRYCRINRIKLLTKKALAESRKRKGRGNRSRTA